MSAQLKPQQPLARKDKNQDASPTDPQGTILLVDDNSDTIEVTRRMIEKFTSFQVLSALTGPEALEILDNNSVDVIVLDYVMPDMDGHTCFRTIRERSLLTPVIFLTGCPSDENKSEQLALGAFDYLEKPIRARDLILLITDAAKANVRIKGLAKKN